MSEWTKVRVADIAAEKGLAGGPFGSSLGTKDYVSAGVPVIRGVNLGSAGSFNDREFVYVAPEKADRDLARNIAIPGDVVFTQRGTLGQVGIIPPSPYERYVISQSQMRLRVRPDLASPEFIYYQFKTPEMISAIHNHAITTGVPHINLRILADLQIRLPSLSEQRAICQLLSALDDKIAINDRTTTALHELATAHYRRAYAENSDWTSRLLGEVARLTMGQSPAGETCNREGIGLPLLNGPTEFGQYSPRPAQWTSAPTRICNTGDLLLCVRGSTTGRLNWADQEYAIGRGLAAIDARQSPRYINLIYLSLIEKMPRLLALASGSVFPNLSRNSIKTFPVAWPAEDSSESLVDLLSSFMNQKAQYAIENKTLTELRDTLLPKLMSGEIRVRDAEKAVEEAT